MMQRKVLASGEKVYLIWKKSVSLITLSLLWFPLILLSMFLILAFLFFCLVFEILHSILKLCAFVFFGIENFPQSFSFSTFKRHQWKLQRPTRSFILSRMNGKLYLWKLWACKMKHKTFAQVKQVRCIHPICIRTWNTENLLRWSSVSAAIHLPLGVFSCCFEQQKLPCMLFVKECAIKILSM